MRSVTMITVSRLLWPLLSLERSPSPPVAQTWPPTLSFSQAKFLEVFIHSRLLMVCDHLQTKTWIVFARIPGLCLFPAWSLCHLHTPTLAATSPSLCSPPVHLPCTVPTFSVVVPSPEWTPVPHLSISQPGSNILPAAGPPRPPPGHSVPPPLRPTHALPPPHCPRLHAMEGPFPIMTLRPRGNRFTFCHLCVHHPRPISCPQTPSVCLLTALLINNILPGCRCSKVYPQAKVSQRSFTFPRLTLRWQVCRIFFKLRYPTRTDTGELDAMYLCVVTHECLDCRVPFSWWWGERRTYVTYVFLIPAKAAYDICPLPLGQDNRAALYREGGARTWTQVLLS